MFPISTLTFLHLYLFGYTSFLTYITNMGLIGPIPRKNGLIVLPHYIGSIISHSVTCSIFKGCGLCRFTHFRVISTGAKGIFNGSHHRSSNFRFLRRHLRPLTLGARTKGSIIRGGLYIRGVIFIHVTLGCRFLILCTSTFSNLRVLLAWATMGNNSFVQLWR